MLATHIIILFKLDIFWFGRISSLFFDSYETSAAELSLTRFPSKHFTKCLQNEAWHSAEKNLLSSLKKDLLLYVALKSKHSFIVGLPLRWIQPPPPICF